MFNMGDILIICALLLVRLFVEIEATPTDGTTRTKLETTTTAEPTAETTHSIKVGAFGHKFSPAEVQAEVGDILEWRFYPDDHWVIRGDFDYPCIPWEYVGHDRVGFSSGSQSVKAITDNGPRFRIRVNDTDPIFFYCGGPGSCVNYHMMGVVNPSGNKSLNAWLEKADQVDFQLRPGDPWPSEEGPPPSSSDIPPGDDRESDDDNSGDADDSSSSSTNDDGDKHHSGLNGGQIAGIVIGSVALLLIASFLIYMCGRNSQHPLYGRVSMFSRGRGPHTDEPGIPHHHRKTASYTSPSELPHHASWSARSSPFRYGGNGHGHGHGPYSPEKPDGPSTVQSPPNDERATSPPYGHGTQLSYPSTMMTSPLAEQYGTLASFYDPTLSRHGPLTLQTSQPTNTAAPPAPAPAPAPVELPSSSDPGNSPLPEYKGRLKRFSWMGSEAEAGLSKR